MAKGKQGPNLFDLIYEGDESNPDSMKVPGWWSGRHTSKLKGRRAANVEGVGPASPTLSEPTSQERGAGELTQPVSFFQIEGPWIRISFTSVSAAGAVLVIVVSMVLCFDWGSRVGYNDGLAIGHRLGQESLSANSIDEIELARTQPANPDLIRPLLEVSDEAGLPESNSSGADQASVLWVKGYTYIVLQEFLPDRMGDASQAQAFLRQQGIDSEIIKTSRGGVQLITTQGYNHRDPAQKKLAEKFLGKIHAAGQSYFAQGGGYRLEGYYKLLKKDTW